MAKNAEFNSWMSGVAKRTRKKKDAGEGKDFQKGEEVTGARAAYGMSGGGAKQAAVAHEKEQDRKYMKRMVNEQKKIMRDPEKKKEQQKTNKQALQNIIRELGNREGPDYGSISDFAQDYVPTDDKMGKVARKVKNQQIARKRLAK